MQSFAQTSTAAGVARARQQIQPTILIAEDSRDGREMMTMLLGLKGYQVFSADNGIQAVQLALASFPNLVLLDLELPRLNGISVAKTLRGYARFAKVPIFIVSGHDPATHRQSALDAGCSGYLTKPIDFAGLDTLLKALVPLN